MSKNQQSKQGQHMKTFHFTLIATELKKGENREGKNCHAETMMNTKS
jgi:hypothetical protein